MHRERWAAAIEYFDTLRCALAGMGTVAMEWALRAACDPQNDPAALLRKQLDSTRAATDAEAVLAAAAALHQWLPLEEISDSAVRAALSARQLATPRSGSVAVGDNGAGDEADSLLKDVSPEQRLKVAKELMETGRADPSLVRSVLAAVDADECEDTTVSAEVERLRYVAC